MLCSLDTMYRSNCWAPNYVLLGRSNQALWHTWGDVAHMGEMRNACIILVGKPEEMEPLEELKLDGVLLKWTVEECEGVDWVKAA